MALRSMNSQQMADKWARNLTASTESMKAGVQSVTVNPAERAIARQDAYVQGVQQAAVSGKWARGLKRTTLQSWQQAMLEKGLNRVATGASAAKPKMAKFLDAWIPWQQQLQSRLQAMPRGGLQQNIARMVAAAEHNASFTYNG